jgi:hypothetical protein
MTVGTIEVEPQTEGYLVKMPAGFDSRSMLDKAHYQLTLWNRPRYAVESVFMKAERFRLVQLSHRGGMFYCLDSETKTCRVQKLIWHAFLTEFRIPQSAIGGIVPPDEPQFSALGQSIDRESSAAVQPRLGLGK